ncbi:ABC transporter permease [Thermogemmatispora onikobensis]|uniref:ABC transporter permease n=1 Tax=Thermogemmatispora onikobensis TaxID=732234 RepID=UPI000852AF21|nr:ABC transporter permease [Thermogemmatispora onikobensis]
MSTDRRYRFLFERERFSLRNAGVVYAFLTLAALLTVATAISSQSNYLDPRNIANIFDQSSLVGLLAISMTVVLISGNFDLSVGSVAALGGAIALSLVDRYGVPVAVIAALLSGVVIGLINGLLVQVVGINAFIVTLGTLTAIRGLVLILTNARTISAQSDAFSVLENDSWTIPHVLLVAGIVLVVVAALMIVLASRRAHQLSLAPESCLLAVAGLAALAASFFADWDWSLSHPTWFLFGYMFLVWLLLRYTVLGRHLYAVGGNAEAARLSGVNVSLYKIGTFVLSGFTAAFVGILYAGKLGAINPNALSGTELTVLAGAILGGTSLFGGSGSVVKSVIGTLILFMLANGFNILNLGANYQGLIEGIVLIVAAGVYTVADRSRRGGRVHLRQAGLAPALREPHRNNALVSSKWSRE